MTTAFRLIAKAIALKTPPRVVFFGLMNKLNFWLKTGNRRYEFERLYSENFDPWGYHSNLYEREKYRVTLDRILKLRRGRGMAIEVGCSLGVFSGLLADEFDQVTSIDISQEALRQARAHNEGRPNLRFEHSAVQAFDQLDKADVITCAEVLYYIREDDAAAVCGSLDRLLATDGLVVYVSGLASGPSSQYYFNGWPQILAEYFREAYSERVDHPDRPYEIIAFERRS